MRSAIRANIDWPDPTLFGWSLSGKTLLPVTTDDVPAPVDMLELTMCGCKSTCTCKCRKFGLVCTDACRCIECENITEEQSDKSDFEVDEDSDEYDEL